MTFMYEKYNDFTASQGRNGLAKTRGINIVIYNDSNEPIPKFVLVPTTSKGEWQNCSIDIPIADFWRMVQELENQGLRP